MNLLFGEVIAELDAGNFTRLDGILSEQHVSIIDILIEAGKPKEYIDEAFAWACMLGRTSDAETLLDLGADPDAGMKSGMAGAHYAASGGRLETIEMLIRRGVPLETVNMYGGTVLGQALWSAINEHSPGHARVIEALIEAGAKIEAGTLEWWNEQNVPSADTKRRVAEVLLRRGEST